jgi:hypothetical protein
MKKIQTEISLEEMERYKRNPERFKGEEIEVLTTCLEFNVMVPIGMNCNNPKCVNCRNFEEVNYANK